VIFNIQPHERHIFHIIQEASIKLGFPTYAVGGFVRDRLLGRPSKDIDIVCVGDGITLAETVAELLKPVPRVTVFRRFGTAMIRYGDIEIEFVGARKESYNLNSRKPVVQEGSLEDDQNRRDFTINALAVSLNESNFGEIIDPFDGLVHLEQKRILTPLEPGRTFSDDPLRMMRAVRFATQLNFTVDPETLEAIRVHKERIHIISKERIATELNKILLSPKPSIGFLLLDQVELLQIILPDLVALKGVEFVNGIGHKDNFYHTLEVVDNIVPYTSDLWLIWAALLHDIAKPPTKRFDPQFGWTFHGHETLGAAMAARIFKNLKLPLDHKLKYIQKLIRLHLRPISLTKESITDSAVRRLLVDAGEEIDDLMTLCHADVTSKNREKADRYRSNYEVLKQKMSEIEEKDALRNWQPPITGEDIMSYFDLKPGKIVGDLKNALREAILEGKVADNAESARAYVMEIAQQFGLATKSN